MILKHKLIIWIALFTSMSYAQSGTAPKVPLYKMSSSRNKSNIALYLNATKWNELFPNRHGMRGKNPKKPATDFYSFKALVEAAKHFPDFLTGSVITQKRELAAFLANIAQETSGGWVEAPGGYFKWGLYFVEEVEDSSKNKYADATKVNYPPVPGKSYLGRGPKQLSWNYNYGQFSEAWFGTKNTLLQHPELLAQDPELSFASAIWFWITPQFPKPSCHQIMDGTWKPTENDLQKGRIPGFGATVNVINGGVECGKGGNEFEKTGYRYKYYLYFCHYLNVSPGENISCSNQKPFGQ